MILEIYIAGTEHPALYDAYIDTEGTLWGMTPPPPAHDTDLVQVVLQRGFATPNEEQWGAITFLQKMNNASVQLFFDDYAMQR